MYLMLRIMYGIYNIIFIRASNWTTFVTASIWTTLI
jgi:hypothetical protein